MATDRTRGQESNDARTERHRTTRPCRAFSTWGGLSYAKVNPAREPSQLGRLQHGIPWPPDLPNAQPLTGAGQAARGAAGIGGHGHGDVPQRPPGAPIPAISKGHHQIGHVSRLLTLR